MFGHRIRSSCLGAVVTASFFGLVPNASPVQAGMIFVNNVPETKSVLVDESFTLRITADISENILGFGFDLSFDPALLAITQVRIADPFLPLQSSDGDEFAALAYPYDVTGTAVELAAVTFIPLVPGKAEITVGVTAGDPTEGFPEYPVGQWGIMQVSPATVTIELPPSNGQPRGIGPDLPLPIVPEPATGLLIATVFGLPVSRCRRGSCAAITA